MAELPAQRPLRAAQPRPQVGTCSGRRGAGRRDQDGLGRTDGCPEPPPRAGRDGERIPRDSNLRASPRLVSGHMKEPGRRSYRRRAPWPFPWSRGGQGTRARVARIACPFLATGPLGNPSWRWTLLEPSKRRFHSIPQRIVGDSGVNVWGPCATFPSRGQLRRDSALPLIYSPRGKGVGRLREGTRFYPRVAPALKKCCLKKHTTAWTERTQARAVLPTPFPEGCRVRELPPKFLGLCPLAASGLLSPSCLVSWYLFSRDGGKSLPCLPGLPRGNDHEVPKCGPFVPPQGGTHICPVLVWLGLQTRNSDQAAPH